MVFYPLFGTREIQINDKVIFFDKDGQELCEIFLNAYEEGLLSFLKLEIIDDLGIRDRKSTRLNSSHVAISYAVFCLKKKKKLLHYHLYAQVGNDRIRTQEKMVLRQVTLMKNFSS